MIWNRKTTMGRQNEAKDNVAAGLMVNRVTDFAQSFYERLA
jgi:hypothetical protein